MHVPSLYYSTRHTVHCVSVKSALVCDVAVTRVVVVYSECSCVRLGGKVEEKKGSVLTHTRATSLQV